MKMEDKEQYTTKEIIKKFQSLLPHKKTIEGIANYHRIEGARKVFEDLEKLDNVFMNYDIVIKGNKYKKIKERHLNTRLNDKMNGDD